VFNAAAASNVKKIVVTSSAYSIYLGYTDYAAKSHFDEKDWSIDEGNLEFYAQSKVRAEKRAWELYKENGKKMKMTVINPSFIMGANLTSNCSYESANYIRDVMNG